MPRSIWKGTISFGLIEIPVALYAAEERGGEIHFSLVDKRDFAAIGYEKVNKRTGERVPWEEIVRAYEHEDGEFVVMTEADLKRANVEATQTIDIVDFVDGEEIESVFYDRPYYLEPVKKKKSKSYALLREALRQSGRVGIAKVVIRSRQSIAAVTVRGDALVLNVLRYAHELRDPDELELPGGTLAEMGIQERELEMAGKLIDGMTSAFEPEKYKDEYREDVLALVQKKIDEGQTHVVEEEAPEEVARPKKGEVIDLMPLLKQSLERSGRKVAAAPARPKAKAKAKRKRA